MPVTDGAKAHRTATEMKGPEPIRWYACYTRARHEKRVDELLTGQGIETFLPLMARERQWKDRRKMVEFPLFPSYVFARFEPASTHQILTTPGVSTIVRIGSRPIPIPDEDIENVRLLVERLNEAGEEPELRPYLEEGQRVRVQEGPFAGVEGVVVERRGRRRVLVGLSAIRQGLEIDVAAERLVPVKQRAG